jgi:hypothetical protein
MQELEWIQDTIGVAENQSKINQNCQCKYGIRCYFFICVTSFSVVVHFPILNVFTDWIYESIKAQRKLKEDAFLVIQPSASQSKLSFTKKM